MGKKALCLVFAFLLSIESFAAIVSDNDGAAFVTKAEFDALKNNFANQVDQYNTSIDSKIDGAIASYLAGVNLFKNENADIIFKDWEEVSCFSGNISPTFVLPDWNGSTIYTNPHREDVSATRQDWKGFQIALKFNYTNTANKYNTRPLITGITEGANWANGATWNGVAIGFREYFTFLAFTINDINPHALNDPYYYSFTAGFKNFNELNLDGYYPNLQSDWIDRWGLVFTWNYSGTMTGSTTYSGVRTGNFNKAIDTNVVLEKVDGKTKNFEHILQYDGAQSWEVSNEKCLKTFKQCTGVGTSTNTNTSTTMFNTATNSSKFMYEAFDLFSSGTSGVTDGRTIWYGSNMSELIYEFNNDATFTNTDDAGKVLPSIGYLGSLSANNIKQFENSLVYNFNKKEYVIEPVKLHEGFPLLYAPYGTEITWTVNFKKGKKLSSGTWIDSTNKARLALSLGPFVNKDTATNIISISKDDGASYANYQICDIEKDTKIKFKMPKEGIVYAKWWDDSTNYDTTSWIQTLDVTKSNKFKYVLDY